jgi:F-type H+-transporting ATPase subunit delta
LRSPLWEGLGEAFNMSATKLASRYAKSLLDLATEQGQLDAVHADMEVFQDAAKNNDLRMLLKSPIVNVAKKQQIILAIFGDKFNKISIGFLNLICAKSREEYLPEIATEFMNQYRGLKGISSVKITTATALDTASVDAIKAKLIATKAVSASVDVTTAVKPELIGGFVLEFDGNQYDASVSRQLYLLKDRFDDNDYISQVSAR